MVARSKSPMEELLDRILGDGLEPCDDPTCDACIARKEFAVPANMKQAARDSAKMLTSIANILGSTGNKVRDDLAQTFADYMNSYPGIDGMKEALVKVISVEDYEIYRRQIILEAAAKALCTLFVEQSIKIGHLPERPSDKSIQFAENFMRRETGKTMTDACSELMGMQ